MDTQNLTSRVEEATLNAWPAQQTWADTGWLLRFNGGYTRRSNSINPIYTKPDSLWMNDTIALEERIRRLAGVYHRLGLPAVFKITPLACPAHLDETLARLGFHKEGASGVRTRPLANFAPTVPPAAGLTVQGSDELTGEWLERFMRLNEVPAESRDVLWRTLANLLPAYRFLTLWDGPQPVACGLGVCQNGFLGFFDIVTATHARRQGHGLRLMEALLEWGQSLGAHTAYLQVMDSNRAARQLYSRLGFAEIYKYWYRVQPRAE